MEQFDSLYKAFGHQVIKKAHYFLHGIDNDEQNG
jgi:hypothetical protein